MSTPLKISVDHARRFQRRAVNLDAPVADVGAALAHHGYIQIDPINICGRMHDLILRNRVAGYREGDLVRHLHGEHHAPLPPAQRVAYEHYLPGATSVLVAYPLESWPFFAAPVRARRLRGGVHGRKLAPTYELLAQRILGEIAERGPLTSDDIEHDARSRTGWGTPGRLVKAILEILLVHGRVLISSRRHFRRVYDLPERVLPASILNAAPATGAETERWRVLLKLRQRRLVMLKRAEIPLVADLVQRIAVDGGPPLHCLKSDLPVLAETENPKSKNEVASRPLLLAPLDPLIYDRRVTSALWNFDYTWEVYTPQHKRVRGYYALPILASTEIVGHVDTKADRPARKLRVVSKRVKRGYKITDSLRHFADWLGLSSAPASKS
ncbi:MAG TPA: crosslink repair DNA glycosylase YcaQ family protein [Candidatus Didemnitutus sp.]|nr:crosslink repair DNA glycosylase YcaQ family protein [Candidatus Didemnitutus sp.]